MNPATGKNLTIQWYRIPRFITWFVLVCFSFTTLFPPSLFAQTNFPVGTSLLGLPQPGVMVNPTANFVPVILKGVKVYADNPLRFDFIMDSGDTKLEGEDLKGESEKLIKYFLASLTTPEEDLWVNLSPYEKDRIIPDKFGTTEMGRDLLAQDYLLKQLTASLMYPEDDLGKEFWDRIYKKAFELYQTTNIPINTFNKVWIVPQKAVVYETKDTAFVVESHLKVMLEGDYLALKENLNKEEIGTDKLADRDVKQLSDVSSGIVRDVILPAIEKEVNEGKNFSQLRQIYHALILSVWYKKRLRESLLGRVYVDKNKVTGVDVEDKDVRQKIYNQYLEAFKKGVYDYIKDDYDPYINRTLSRQYFSGGFIADNLSRETTFIQVNTSEKMAVLRGIRDSAEVYIQGNLDRLKDGRGYADNDPAIAEARRLEAKAAYWRREEANNLDRAEALKEREKDLRDEMEDARVNSPNRQLALETERGYKEQIAQINERLKFLANDARTIKIKLNILEDEINALLNENKGNREVWKLLAPAAMAAENRAPILKLARTDQQRVDLLSVVSRVYTGGHLLISNARDEADSAMHASVIDYLIGQHLLNRREFDIVLKKSNSDHFKAIVTNRAIAAKLITDKKEIDTSLKEILATVGEDEYVAGVMAAIQAKAIATREELDSYLNLLDLLIPTEGFDVQASRQKLQRYRLVVVEAIKAGVILNREMADHYLQNLEKMSERLFERGGDYSRIVSAAIEYKLFKSKNDIDVYLEKMLTTNQFDGYKAIVVAGIDFKLITERADVDSCITRLEEKADGILSRPITLAIQIIAIKNQILKDKKWIENEPLKTADLFGFREQYIEIIIAMIDSKVVKSMAEVDPFLQKSFFEKYTRDNLSEILIAAINGGIIITKKEMDSSIKKFGLNFYYRQYANIVSAGIKANFIDEVATKKYFRIMNLAKEREGMLAILEAVLESDPQRDDARDYLAAFPGEYGMTYSNAVINSARAQYEKLISEEVAIFNEDDGLPTSFRLTVHNLRLALMLPDAAPLNKLASVVLNEVRNKNQLAVREDQEIDVEDFELFLLRGLANMFVVSEGMTKQIIDIQLNQRGYLPLIKEIFEIWASLDIEDVFILKGFYEKTGNRFANRPNDLLSLVGYAEAYTAVGFSKERFRDDLMAQMNGTMENIQQELGQKVLQEIADQLGIEINLSQRTATGRDVLKEWDLRYLGLFVSAKNQWGEKDEEFFRLLFRAAIEGNTAALIFPPSYKDFSVNIFGENNADLVQKIRRYNLNLLKMMESLGLNLEPWLFPNEAVEPVIIGGAGTQRRPFDILRDFRERLGVFKQWLLTRAEGNSRWEKLSKSMGNDWAKINENPSAVLLTDPNKRKSLKTLKSFIEGELLGHNNEAAIIGIAQILDEIKYYKVMEEDTGKESYRIRFWRREVGRDAVLGNCAGSCTSLGSNATAIFQFLLDQGTQYVVIESLKGDVVKGYARFFLTRSNKKRPMLFIDSIDGTVAARHESQLKAQIVQLAIALGLTKEDVEDRSGGIVEEKVGGALTESYFNHSGVSFSVLEEDEEVDQWQPKNGWPAERVGGNHILVDSSNREKFDGGIDLKKTKDTVEFKGNGTALPVISPDPAAIREFETLPFSGVTFQILYMGPVPDISAFVGEIPAEDKTDSAGGPQSRPLSKGPVPLMREDDCPLTREGKFFPAAELFKGNKMDEAAVVGLRIRQVFIDDVSGSGRGVT